MPDIIRIRNLVQETNLNDIIFPVDKESYLDDAHKIGMNELKEYILSGFTGGGGTASGGTSGTSGIDGVDGSSGTTPCKEFLSNEISIVVLDCNLDGVIDCNST